MRHDYARRPSSNTAIASFARDAEPVKLIWLDMDASRSALGLAATRTFLAEKLKRPGTFNVDMIAGQLAALERGAGQTYFDIVLEIIGDHPNIELVAA